MPPQPPLSGQTYRCVWYDEANAIWSTEGLDTDSSPQAGNLRCLSYFLPNLTYYSIAIVQSQTSETPQSTDAQTDVSVGLIAGGASAGAVCIVCLPWLILLCKRRCRTPKRGQSSITLNNDNRACKSIPWHIAEADNSQEGGMKKVHVIWQVDEDIVKSFTMVADETNRMMQLDETAPANLDTATSAGAAAAGAAVPAAESPRRLLDLLPAYEEGAVVEYYHRSGKRWLPGKLHLTLALHPNGDRRVVYNVRLPRNRGRADVPLEKLRLQLQADEPVDLLQRLPDGSLAWQPATVDGVQRVSCTTVGYRVALPAGEEEEAPPRPSDASAGVSSVAAIFSRGVSDVFRSSGVSDVLRSSSFFQEERIEDPPEPRQALGKVPAGRLRRRFEAGARAEVYRGPSAGWAQAEVVRQLPGDWQWAAGPGADAESSAAAAALEDEASSEAASGGEDAETVRLAKGDLLELGLCRDQDDAVRPGRIAVPDTPENRELIQGARAGAEVCAATGQLRAVVRVTKLRSSSEVQVQVLHSGQLAQGAVASVASARGAMDNNPWNNPWSTFLVAESPGGELEEVPLFLLRRSLREEWRDQAAEWIEI